MPLDVCILAVLTSNFVDLVKRKAVYHMQSARSKCTRCDRAFMSVLCRTGLIIINGSLY